jgi:hypothetical protein
MQRQYEPQRLRLKEFPSSRALELPNALEQQVMVYEAAENSINKCLEYLKTKLEVGRLVQTTTSIKSYAHDTPITDYIGLIGTYFFGKSASQKNRDAKKRKEREQKKAEKQKQMKTPGGNSKYAKKADSGNEKFWKGRSSWTPTYDWRDNYR